MLPNTVKRVEAKPIGVRAIAEHGSQTRKILAVPRKNGAWKTTRKMNGVNKGTRVSARDYDQDRSIKAKTKLPDRKKLKYGHRGD